jgi:hypothetical protein
VVGWGGVVGGGWVGGGGGGMSFSEKKVAGLIARGRTHREGNK